MPVDNKLRKTPGNTEWFIADRFGMFIHWGLYSLPARHEWVRTNEKMSKEDYTRYFNHFDPDLYKPKEWARMAREAGMKYVVITTKHHEGFCLWDTKYTEFKAPNTPAGGDLIAPLVEAFRSEGLKIGFYYSLIDWNHLDFTIDIIHSDNKNEEAINENKRRDMKKYAKYMRDQVRELLTCYGTIDILWFDFSYCTTEQKKEEYYKNLPGVAVKDSRLEGKGKDDWESEELIRLVRGLQPEIVINNRTEIEQDIWTPEQFQPVEWVRHEKTGERVVWEACQTFSGSWGYSRDELTWKTPEQLVKMLVNTVSCGGNLLLNIGPTSRGEFDSRAVSELQAIGKWMNYNCRSIYNCTASDFKPPKDCRYTQNDTRLYLHIFSWPFKHILLEGMCDKIEYAQFLHDGSEVILSKPRSEGQQIPGQENDLLLNLPVNKPDVLVPVIEIFIKQ